MGFDYSENWNIEFHRYEKSSIKNLEENSKKVTEYDTFSKDMAKMSVIKKKKN